MSPPYDGLCDKHQFVGLLSKEPISTFRKKDEFYEKTGL